MYNPQKSLVPCQQMTTCLANKPVMLQDAKSVLPTTHLDSIFNKYTTIKSSIPQSFNDCFRMNAFLKQMMLFTQQIVTSLRSNNEQSQTKRHIYNSACPVIQLQVKYFLLQMSTNLGWTDWLTSVIQMHRLISNSKNFNI